MRLSGGQKQRVALARAFAAAGVRVSTPRIESLARSAGEHATMPPSGGVSAEERRRLTAWLTCFEAGDQ